MALPCRLPVSQGSILGLAFCEYPRMDRSLFAASDAGRVVRTRTGYDAFVPADVPPHLDWDTRVVRAVETAARAVGEVSSLLSCATSGRFLDLLLWKEAVAAASVEGQPLTIGEAFTAIATGVGVPRGAQLTLNYVDAFHHVAARLNEMPLSLRLVREAHYLLSQGLEHSGSYPGEFRRSQNWLGPEGCSLSNATMVPPPVGEMKSALDNWERYLHSTDTLPAVVRIAILHYQFAVIRPFLEYNDAALLAAMPFLLQELGQVKLPVPALGGFIRRRLQEYQQRMLDVCQRAAWNEWLTFYLFGLAGACKEAVDTIERLATLRVQQEGLLQDSSQLAMQVLELVYRQPVLTVASTSRLTGSPETDTACALVELANLGILEPQGLSSDDTYVATGIIAALEQTAAFGAGYPPFF